MTLIQWLCGLAGHRWDWQVCRCISCNVTETAWLDRPRLFGNRATWHNGYVTIFGLRVGFQYAPLFIKAAPYMTRYIVYLGPINLRLHQFFRGDDDRAPHNHPWWFITFPFTDYDEYVFEHGVQIARRRVKAWRFHFRPASFEHIVINRSDFARRSYSPFWTFVIAGSRVGEWGFYPEPGVFVPWQEFKP